MSASPSGLHEERGDPLSDVDRSVVTGEFAEYEVESTRAGLEHAARPA